MRGLAAAYVVVFHAAFIPGFKVAPPSDIKSIVVFGGSGVTLFFVISAFSLVMTMGRHLATEKPLLSFFASRFFRIAPLFYVMIAFTLVFHWQSFGLTHSPFKVLASLLFIFNLIPGYQEGFVWASWTIGVEMLFYALFPLLYFALNSAWKKAAAIIVSIALSTQITNLVALLMPSVDPASFYLFTILRHLPVFLIGMITFDMFKLLSYSKADLRLPGAGLLALGIGGLGYLVYGGTALPFVNLYYWQAAFYAVILIGVALLPLKIIVNRATRYMGKISYSMYLVHAPILFFLSPVFQTIYETGLQKPLAYTASIAVTYCLVIIVATALYWLVEKPGEKLGKMLFASRPITPLPASAILPAATE